jgi:hypothetical protein
MRCGPLHGPAVVENVLEDVEHRQDVETPGYRLWNGVFDDWKFVGVFVAQQFDGARVHLRAQHGAEARQHSQVATAGASDLGNPSSSMRGHGEKPEDDLFQDVASRAPPPVTVFD